MPHIQIGFGLLGLVGVGVEFVLATFFIWLMVKLGRLADAYTAKLKKSK